MLREEKNALRKKYKQLRKELPCDRKSLMDQKIADRIRSLISFRFSKTVLLYYPIEGEVDTLPILESALAAGKNVGLPVSHSGGRMEFRLVTDPERELAPGRFGVREPSADCPIFDKAAADPADTLILVPALAFDREGFRLGYGNGYYDRYLEGFPATAVGLVYSDFLADRLPKGRFDQSVSLLVTEKGVIFVGKEAHA